MYASDFVKAYIPIGSSMEGVRTNLSKLYLMLDYPDDLKDGLSGVLGNAFAFVKLRGCRFTAISEDCFRSNRAKGS